MNLLRRAAVLTFDADLWTEAAPENLRRCEQALAELHAEWQATVRRNTPQQRLELQPARLAARGESR